MKIRKLMAALLCFAVAVTSPGVNAMASDMITSGTGDVVLSEIADTEDVLAGETEQEPVAAEVTDATDDDSIVEEATDVLVTSEDIVETVETGDVVTADDVDEDEDDALDSDVIEGDDAPDKYTASSCFDKNSTVLKLADGYTGKVSNYVTVPVIPKKVETIPADIFAEDTGLQGIEFEDGSALTTIEEGAFKNSSIQYFEAPKGYTTIEDSTFEGCRSLISFNFRNITSIGNSAFSGANQFGKDMSKIAGGYYVTNIGARAFANTGFINLNLAKFTSDTITVGEGAFSDCRNLTSAVIPDGFTSIPDSCFADCSKLTKITMGRNVASIGKNAFNSCTSLTTVVFNTTSDDNSIVASVDDKAFYSCGALKTISFPKACTLFGDEIFIGCNALTDVYFYCRDNSGLATEFEIGEAAFSGLAAVKVHGYDELVMQYCTRKGITFETLNDKYSVIGKNLNSSFTSCKIMNASEGNDKKDVPVGTEVVFTVKPKDNVIVVDKIYDKNDKNLKINYVRKDGRNIVLSFKMPSHDVELMGTAISSAHYQALKLTYSIGEYNDENLYRQTSDGYSTEKTGNRGLLSARLQGTYGGQPYDLDLGVWNTSYGTNSPSVVDIDPATGLITAKKAGNAAINVKALPSPQKTVTFRLQVVRTVEFKSIEFDNVEFLNHPGKSPADAYLDDEEVYFDEEPDLGKHIYYINYLKNEVASTDRKFKIRFEALDSDDGAMFLDANWMVTDPNIASVEYTTTKDNYNIVTIKKGTYGSVTIKAYYRTGEKYDYGKKKNQEIIRYAYATVNIMDPAPTTDKNIRVNKQRSLKEKNSAGEFLPEKDQNYGVEIPIIERAGYEASTISEDIYQLNSSTNKYEVFKGLKLVATGKIKNNIPQYRLYVTDEDPAINSLPLKKELVYNGANKLYIRGIFEDEDLGDFYTPIENLVIFNELPQPKIAQTGIINTFYNSKCYNIAALDYIGWEDVLGKDAKKDAENVDKYANATIGTIHIAQSYSKAAAEVDYARSMMVDDDNYTRYAINKDVNAIVDTEKRPDLLRNNFVLLPDPDSENNFIVKRSDKEMKKNDSGQEVSRGVLFIYYKGYKDPFVVGIQLNVGSKGPTYTQTQKASTASVLSGNADLKFKFISNKTKEAAFTKDDVESFVVLRQYSDEGFADPVAIEDDYWNLVMSDPRAGKKLATMQLKLKNWDKTINYTYNVTVVDSDPIARLSRTALNLNSRMTGDEAVGESILTLSHYDATASIDSIEFAGGIKQADEAEKISITWETSTDYKHQCTVRAEITDDSIKRGNYRFKIIPHASYTKAEKSLKEVYLNVAVTDVQPTMRLHTTALTFNLDYPGIETNKSIVTGVAGITAGIVGFEVKEDEGMKIEIDDLDLVYAGNLKNAVMVTDAECVKEAIDIKLVKKQNETTKKWYYELDVQLGEMGAAFSGKALNIPFNMTGVKVNGAEVRPIRITIRSTRNRPVISLKASGGLNPVDPASYVKYVLTVKNLVNPEVTAAEVLKYDNDIDVRDYVVDDDFVLEKDEDEDNIWYLKINHDLDGDPETRFKSGRHQIFLNYQIAGVYFRSGSLVVAGNQSMPKITQEISVAPFYAKQSEDDRQVTYMITKNSILKGHVADVKISDNNPAELKNAFEIEYESVDEDTDARMNMKATTTKWDAGKITLKCKKPERLQAQKTYNLNLEVIADGQFYKRNNKGDLVLDDDENPVLTPGTTISIKVVVIN